MLDNNVIKDKSKIKVLVGLSGGVDSAVAAHLLVKEGYQVSAAFMRNWDSTANNDFLGNPTLEDNICPQEQDYLDAKEVAEKLGIELMRVDFVKEYWDNVFTYFIEEYRLGRTPNPDILCNKYIKFDHFLRFAIDNGFDYLATGHYADIEHTESSSFLKIAEDQNKDQTYFLSQLNQEQLRYCLFPLANYSKPQIREIALELGLNVATKKDSTGICFIGERNFRDFLQNYIPNQNGDIVEYETKEVVGQHIGVMYYTIGQSKGLALGGNKNFGPGKWYVVGKDIDNKILYVSNRHDNLYLKSNKILVTNVNINNDNFKNIEKAQAKFRYRQKMTDVNIEWIDENNIYVYNDELPLSNTPGQECVLYSNDYCIGGGTISKIFKDEKELDYV